MSKQTSGQAYEQPFHDEPALWLTWGNYEAAVLPNIGANLIAFRDTSKQISFLREPAAEEMEDFRQRPVLHGVPLLFPPNRYEDGTFTWNGITYTFPVNEEKTHNHLHGFFSDATFIVEDLGTSKTESYAVLSITIDENHPIYSYLPHHFTIRIRYTLSEQGLLMHVQVHNIGTNAMPCLIGFHTTLNAPFDPNSSHEDYKFTVTAGKRWELNERMLPTGQTQPLTAAEQQMKTDGVSPFFAAMDNHYSAEPHNGRNQMRLTDTRTNTTLVYDAGTAYKQWMIYNNNATPGFFCPEPQLNLVNAPNVALDTDKMGLVTLEPASIWEETSRFYVI
ncbi:aldose 1-epimerase [Paenibacillus yanchengensis]|uniref:Aldose 1-epimerase n=1 Tax=Paenibacillus yanchengensis TaxID=2035833 RepID=A0ABW4YM50_9BACL